MKQTRLLALILTILLALSACSGGENASSGQVESASRSQSASQPASAILSSVAPVSAEETFTLRYATADVNLRAGPGTTYTIRDVVPLGEAVKAYETQNGWTRVIYKDQHGYISEAYLAAEPFLSTEDRIDAILKEMTLEERWGRCSLSAAGRIQRSRTSSNFILRDIFCLQTT